MAGPRSSTSGDLESGCGGYPKMTENPDLRWAFIRKVYSILAIQLLLTVGVAVVVINVHAIPKFVLGSKPGLALFVVTLVLPLILLCPLSAYRKHHPVNLVLLAAFTVTIAFAVGLSCSFSTGKIILLAGILTSVVTLVLTLYTFWAAKQEYDFQFLSPFLLVSLLILITFSLIQVFIPFGKLGRTIFAGIGAIIFSAFIIYDTDNLIKRFDYDEHIWAAVSLYLDLVNLFMAMLGVGGGGGRDN